MNLKKTLIISGTIGFAVPVLFTGYLAIVDLGGFDLWLDVVDARLILWPTSIMLMALDDGLSNWALPHLEFMAIVALLNVPVYMLGGVIVWIISKIKLA